MIFKARLGTMIFIYASNFYTESMKSFIQRCRLLPSDQLVNDEKKIQRAADGEMPLVSDVDGRTNGAEADIRVDDFGVGIGSLDLSGNTRVLRARATSGAGLALLLRRVDRIEPEHICVVLLLSVFFSFSFLLLFGGGEEGRAGWLCVYVSWVGGKTYIVPDRHDKNHGNSESGVELRETANLFKAVAVAKGGRSSLTELGSNVTSFPRNTIPLGWGCLDLLAALDEKLGKPVLAELGYNSELLARVDGEALAVKIGIAHAIGIIVAAVSVAATCEAVFRVGTTAVGRFANVVLVILASVRRKGKGVRIGLPNVDLGAAAAIRTDTSVGVISRRSPALNIRLTANELEIAGALGVAILFLVLGCVSFSVCIE